MKLTYAEVEDFIASYHNVDDDKRGALRGRIKHFQRLSWPPGTRLGKGARVQYGAMETLCLSMAFDLVQLGLTPEWVRTLLNFAGSGLADGFIAALTEYPENADPVYYLFAPTSGWSLSLAAGEEGVWSYLASRTMIPFLLENDKAMNTSPRLGMVNISSSFTAYVDFLILRRKITSATDLLDELKAWKREEVSVRDANRPRIMLGGQNGLST